MEFVTGLGSVLAGLGHVVTPLAAGVVTGLLKLVLPGPLDIIPSILDGAVQTVTAILNGLV